MILIFNVKKFNEYTIIYLCFYYYKFLMSREKIVSQNVKIFDKSSIKFIALETLKLYLKYFELFLQMFLFSRHFFCFSRVSLD